MMSVTSGSISSRGWLHTLGHDACMRAYDSSFVRASPADDDDDEDEDDRRKDAPASAGRILPCEPTPVERKADTPIRAKWASIPRM